ncbi:zinc-ribbon domain-containing protein, partial [Aedoeadaptatus coxii]
MKCRYCGNENPLGEKFCTSCGTPLVYHLGEKEED